MKKIILSLVLVASFVCTAIVPASAVFVSSTTLSTEIKSEVEMWNTYGMKVDVETYTSSNQEEFKTTAKPAISVTSAASVKTENTAEANGNNSTAAAPAAAFEKVIEAVTAADTMEELVELLDLNALVEQSPSSAAAEKPIDVSDYAVVDVAYVEVNKAMQAVINEMKDENGEIAEAPVVTVEVAGITAASEVVVVFVPNDPTAPSQVVEATVNWDGTLSFEYIANGTYMFLVKVK